MVRTGWNHGGCLLDWCLRCVVLPLSPKLWCLAVAEGSMTASDAQFALCHPWDVQQACGRICEQISMSARTRSLMLSNLGMLQCTGEVTLAHARHLCKPGIQLCQRDSTRPHTVLVLQPETTLASCDHICIYRRKCNCQIDSTCTPTWGQTESGEVGAEKQSALKPQSDPATHHRGHIMGDVMGKLTIFAVTASPMHMVSA